MDWVVNAILALIIAVVVVFVGGIGYFIWMTGYHWLMVVYIAVVLGILWWISGD